MKYLFCWIFLFLACCTQAQDSIFVKTNKGDSAYIVMPKEKSSVIKTVVPFLPLLSIFIALLGIAYQIKARRKDDTLKNQLDRLNKQITDFYGPLYSLYETGHQNYYAYLELYGDEFHFDNQNYKSWNVTIFQPTNFEIEHIIINKADLIIGHIVPEFFFQFCEWLTAQKAYFNAESQPGFDNDIWKPVIDYYQHPKDQMRMYIKASFEILKQTQSEVLSGKLKSISEEVLMNKIIARKEAIINDTETNKWEMSVWEKAAEKKRIAAEKVLKAALIREQEKALIKKSRIPDNWKN